MKTTMYAMLLNEQQELEWRETSVPTLHDHEVAIEVKAAGINRADLMQKAGHYPPPPGASDILGLECAGIITAVGKDVTQWQVGDRVCALLSGGGYAQTVVCPAQHCLPVPEGMDFYQAAALPEVFATAWLNIFQEAQTPAGKPVLIHAGASGVGTAAIQLCKALGHPCFVTVSSTAKLDHCLALGATAGALYTEGDFTDAAKAFTQKQGFATILDPVGGSYLPSNIALLSTDGALVIIGIMGGRKSELDLGRLLVKRLRVLGSTLRSRSDANKSQLITELATKIWPLFNKGILKPQIETRYNIQSANTALAQLAANNTVGKIILDVT